MGEELPILKGILKGVVSYHNAPVRFGRVPKREKARILAAMQSQQSQQQSQSRDSVTSNGHGNGAQQQFNHHATAMNGHGLNGYSNNSHGLSHAMKAASQAGKPMSPWVTSEHVVAELEDTARLQAAVTRAHLDTCEFTADRVREMQARAMRCPAYSAPTLACPLNPAPELQSEQEFSQRFAHVIRGVIDFAGLIPGFRLLCQEDKFALLKAGLFDALFVRLIRMFDPRTASVICLNGQILQRDSIQSNSSNAKYLVDSTFEFAERINSMRLTDAEVGLFSAIVLISPDRVGLKDRVFIEKMHARLKTCLQASASRTRPQEPDFVRDLLAILPDLRMLSTLHTEKLVVFRTEHKEQMLRQQLESESPPVATPVSTTFKEAPLLAASLTAVCPRLRANSGSSGDEEFASRLAQNGLTITPVGQRDPRYRKLDSPTDSGIESGNENKDHKNVCGSGSSSCSSPRSSSMDLASSGTQIAPAEDMPVLKRVLQAPPLYDTNSLMDEAYKPHKKFRAMRQKDSTTSAEAEPRLMQPVQSQLQLHLTRPLTTQKSASLSTTHSELARTLRAEPRMTPEQMKRADIIQNYLARAEAREPSSAQNGSGSQCPYAAWTSVIRSPARYFQSPHSTLSPSPEPSPQRQSHSPQGVTLGATPPQGGRLSATPPQAFRVSASPPQAGGLSPNVLPREGLSPVAVSRDRLSPPTSSQGGLVGDAPLNLSTKSPSPQPFLQARLLQA